MRTNKQWLKNARAERDLHRIKAIAFIERLERWQDETRPKEDKIGTHEFCVVKTIKEIAQDTLLN